MRTRAVLVLTALAAACWAVGCMASEHGQAAPDTSASISPSSAPASTTPSSAPPTSAPSASASPSEPAEPPTIDVNACYDASCTLQLSGPVTIPLDADTFHYSEMQVTSVSENNLKFFVPYSDGGGLQASISNGGTGSFYFRSMPKVVVRFSKVDGKPALVLSSTKQ